jgi:hypothetical protein
MALADIKVQASSANMGTPGCALTELTAQYNALAAKFETLMEKLDGDGGITDTNYEATVGLTKRVVFAATGAPTAS